MLKKILVYIVGIGLLITMALAAQIYARSAKAGQEKKRKEAAETAAAEEQRATQVKICRIFLHPLTDTLVLPGSVEAYQDIDLAARMGGTIEWLGPKEGDRIKKGDKILEVDTESIQARVAQARTAHELAELKFRRISELYEKKVATVDQLDDARSSLKTTQAALDEAEITLKHGALYSPLDGILDRRHVDLGEHIAEGQTVAKIVDIDLVKIVVNVPEKDALWFKTGQEVTMRLTDSKDEIIKGVIEFVAMTAEPATRTFPVKIRVENQDHNLRPGMILRGSLIRRQLDKAIAIPYFTIMERKGQKIVFIADNGVARQRVVKTGIFQGGQMEILDGLSENDQLIVVGQRNLVDGEKIVIVADLTDLAKKFLEEGNDLATIPMELVK